MTTVATRNDFCDCVESGTRGPFAAITSAIVICDAGTVQSLHPEPWITIPGATVDGGRNPIR